MGGYGESTNGTGGWMPGRGRDWSVARAFSAAAMQSGHFHGLTLYFEVACDERSNLPFSVNLNSIVPDRMLLEPSRGILGLKGPHETKAKARFSSVMNGGMLDMYKSGS